MASLAAAAAGCGSVVVQPWPGDAAVADTPATPDAPPPDAPRTCSSSADCNPGEECNIVAQGCDVPAYCGPALGRPCTDDLAPFCGCDGRTFTSSSSCPSRTYAHRGPCEAEDGGPGGCALPDGRVCPVGQTCPLGDGCNSCSCGPGGTLACTGLACVDAGPPPVCFFPDGRTCPVGQRCPAPDGCNVCVCGPGGSLSCTERACVDAGPPPVCTLPDGRACPVGSTCVVDRCTVCFCGAPGMLGCTNMCADAGMPLDVPTPRSCRSNGDCPPSMMCDGPPGCGVPWTCVSPRPCTADLASFCGCDGVTFGGSSTCPGRMYQSRGACPAADGGTVVCRPQDARGEGACDGFFGYAWNGTACVGISGCRCVGADCASLLWEPAACRARYAACRG